MNKVDLKEFLENLVHTIISFFRIIINSRKVKMERTALPSEECIILGNGPSLNDSVEEHPSFFTGKKKFCVNAFAVSSRYEELKPEYYVFADPGIWKKDPLERILKLRSEIFNSIIEKTRWNIEIFIPKEAEGSEILSELEKKNSFVKFKYFNKTTIRSFKCFRNFCYKHNLGIPRAQNVLIPSLVLAINIGFKKIYLLGADHSWHENFHVTDDNIVCFANEHFYDSKELKLIPIMYNDTGKPVKMHEEFYSLYIAFKTYFDINDYAEYSGAKIINASKKTYVDAFDRLKIIE